MRFFYKQLWVATYSIENAIHFEHKNRILIKKRHKSVTIAIMKKVRIELNRAIHKELIDTKFKDIGEGLMTAIS